MSKASSSLTIKGKAGKSQSPTPITNKSQLTSHLASGHELNPALTLLSRLIGYSSSENENADDILIAQQESSNRTRSKEKVKPRKKVLVRRFKSTEVVGSDSDSNALLQKSLSYVPRRKRNTLPKRTQHHQRPKSPGSASIGKAQSSKRHETREAQQFSTLRGVHQPFKVMSEAPGTTTQAERMTSKTQVNGAVMGQKRGAPPIATSFIKRPKTVGGFIDDSDQDSGGESDISKTNNNDSHESEYAFEREKGSEDEDDGPESIPATAPQLKQTPLENRNAGRRPDIEGIRRMLAAKQRARTNQNVSENGPGKGATSLATSTHQRKTPMQAAQASTSVPLNTSKNGTPPARKVLGYHTGSGGPKPQSVARPTSVVPQSSSVQRNTSSARAGTKTSQSNPSGKLSSSLQGSVQSSAGPSVGSVAPTNPVRPTAKKPTIIEAKHATKPNNNPKVVHPGSLQAQTQKSVVSLTGNTLPLKAAAPVAKATLTQLPEQGPESPLNGTQRPPKSAAPAPKVGQSQLTAKKPTIAQAGKGQPVSASPASKRARDDVPSIRPQGTPGFGIYSGLMKEIQQTKQQRRAAVKHIPAQTTPNESEVDQSSPRLTQVDTGKSSAHGQVQKNPAAPSNGPSWKRPLSSQPTPASMSTPILERPRSVGDASEKPRSSAQSPPKLPQARNQIESMNTSPEMSSVKKRKRGDVDRDSVMERPSCKKQNIATATPRLQSTTLPSAESHDLPAREHASPPTKTVATNDGPTGAGSKPSAPGQVESPVAIDQPPAQQMTVAQPSQLQSQKPSKELAFATKETVTPMTILNVLTSDMEEPKHPSLPPVVVSDATCRSSAIDSIPVRTPSAVPPAVAKQHAASWSFESLSRPETERAPISVPEKVVPASVPEKIFSASVPETNVPTLSTLTSSLHNRSETTGPPVESVLRTEEALRGKATTPLEFTPNHTAPTVERKRIAPTNVSGVVRTSPKPYASATDATKDLSSTASDATVVAAHLDTPSPTATTSAGTTSAIGGGADVPCSVFQSEQRPARPIGNNKGGSEISDRKQALKQPKVSIAAPPKKIIPATNHTLERPVNVSPSLEPEASLSTATELLTEEQTLPIVMIPPRSLPIDAEPYFEYSIHKKIWSNTQIEDSVDATEIGKHQYTNVENANIQVERLFSAAREEYVQHFQVQFDEWSTKRDHDDCKVMLGKFASIMYPGRKSWMKIWAQRDRVSELAGSVPSEMKHTTFVAKTAYILRLFKLVSPTNEDGEANDQATPLRVYHPTDAAECYTTLDAAHRAAKQLQIELSHEKRPDVITDKWRATEKWQAGQIEELNTFLRQLSKVQRGQGGYWESEFNGVGLGSNKFQLLVEEVKLCGPRNL